MSQTEPVAADRSDLSVALMMVSKGLPVTPLEHLGPLSNDDHQRQLHEEGGEKAIYKVFDLSLML